MIVFPLGHWSSLFGSGLGLELHSWLSRVSNLPTVDQGLFSLHGCVSQSLIISLFSYHLFQCICLSIYLCIIKKAECQRIDAFELCGAIENS